jgi:hypothetical protein
MALIQTSISPAIGFGRRQRATHSRRSSLLRVKAMEAIDFFDLTEV